MEKKKVTLLLDDVTADILAVMSKYHHQSQGDYLRDALQDWRREKEVLIYRLLTLEDHTEAVGLIIAWWHQQPPIYRAEGSWYDFMEMIYYLLTCTGFDIDEEELKKWNQYIRSNIFTLKMPEAQKYIDLCDKGAFNKEALMEFFGFLHAHAGENVYESRYIPRIFETVFSRCSTWKSDDCYWSCVKNDLIKYMDKIGYSGN